MQFKCVHTVISAIPNGVTPLHVCASNVYRNSAASSVSAELAAFFCSGSYLDGREFNFGFKKLSIHLCRSLFDETHIIRSINKESTGRF